MFIFAMCVPPTLDGFVPSTPILMDDSEEKGSAVSVEFMHVASHKLTLDQALAVLLGFARGEAGTLKYYDFGGRHGPTPSDGVTLEDIGRMMLMNPGLYGSEVAALLDAGSSAPWDLV